MSDKPICLVTAPVGTRSGYGAHSRDICRALIKLDRYDLRIWPVRWGATPQNALQKDDPNDKIINICADIEDQLSGLDEKEKETFMKDIGLNKLV